MRSDWVLDMKKNVWESDVRDDPRFWPEQMEKTVQQVLGRLGVPL